MKSHAMRPGRGAVVVALATVVLTSFACGPKHFSGHLDVARVENGEVYLERVVLPGDRTMIRAVAWFDAPPWQVFNVMADVESFALWHPAVDHMEVLEREDDVLLCRKHVAPILGMRATPVEARIRLDHERLEMSSVAFENDWVRDIQTVIKLEPLGEGTMASLYSHASLKPWWSRASVRQFERTTIEAVHNLRDMVRLPRYAEEPRPAATAGRKVAVPAFQAEGVSESFSRTATRIFAESLMRHGGWNVVTQDEIFALLHHEKSLQLAGCEADLACAIDMGTALDASHIVTGSVARLGESFVVSVALMRLPDGEVERRAAETVESEALLAERLHAAARAVTAR